MYIIIIFGVYNNVRIGYNLFLHYLCITFLPFNKLGLAKVYWRGFNTATVHTVHNIIVIHSDKKKVYSFE